MSNLDVEQLNQRVGQAVARHRKALGMNQEDLAEKLGVGLEAISRLERGRIKPTLVRLLELAEVLGCSVNDLLSETSVNPGDQARYLEQLLARLKQADRQLVVDMVEQLSDRLAQP
ncbi:helix-turn-helix domain-containing protein [Chromobacterium vaccinii]|uniref:Helix-turn-helix transcriptional regulator n=2 Tax=Chromobacterium TaxID=535 RepID=A0ABV0ISE9_9NEIS|nr:MULTISPECIES: helix-turn-helix transcriptional regulator [Chromobacterium]MCD4485344.1 helix-turn-helix domain-containing protein [Chromobacterium vaccinii]MCD4499695.1 helix-turn-helix domain-containing protein [Chromobacterium vaccinii]OHX14146.1 transcriptional regulator [Chromobacterium sphagni]OQS21191.1 transcriptional regulator [Chromobacterium violaceum]QND83276.1 Helix-turn-helix XRE family-like protein [Chromobacterium vaccinii]